MKRTQIQLSGSTLQFRCHPQSLELPQKRSLKMDQRSNASLKQGLSAPIIREYQSPTHFLSFPLRDPNFLKRVDLVQKALLDHSTDVDSNAFMKLEKMHLTVAVMRLQDGEAVRRAREFH